MTTTVDVIAQRLYAAGCRLAFGIPGGEVLAIMEALVRDMEHDHPAEPVLVLGNTPDAGGLGDLGVEGGEHPLHVLAAAPALLLLEAHVHAVYAASGGYAAAGAPA